MPEKSVLLVGNGFVRAVNNAFATDQALSGELAQIQTLWNEFGSTFGAIGDSGNPVLEQLKEVFRNDPETALDALQTTVMFIANMTPLDHLWRGLTGGAAWVGCQTQCLNSLRGMVEQCIYSVIQRFMDAEGSGFYSHVAYAQSESEPLLQLRTLVHAFRDDLSIFTTNYDGLCDQLLTCQDNKYFMGDGFGGYTRRSQDNSKGIWFDWDGYLGRLSAWGTIAHLHGSYKFAMMADGQPSSGIDCIKLKIAGYEDFRGNPLSFVPVVVLDAPSAKMTRIQSLPILVAYYNSLRGRLVAARRIVIWGMSLRNDRHIATAVAEAGAAWPSGEGELVIIDPAPQDVLGRIDWPRSYRLIDPRKHGGDDASLLSVLEEALSDFTPPS
jgi:hypothetical protein